MEPTHPTDPPADGTDPAAEPELKAPEPGPDAPPEEFRWQGRTSWKHYTGHIAFWASVGLVYVVLIAWLASSVEAFSATAAWYVTGIPVLLGTAYGVARLGWRILAWRYRVTDERLFIEQGVLSQTINQTELIRVDDVRVRKTVVDRLFGLGSVDVLSTDTTNEQVSLEGVVDADGVAEVIRDRMRKLRRKSLFIENL